MVPMFSLGSGVDRQMGQVEDRQSDINSCDGGTETRGAPKSFYLDFDEVTKMLQLFKHFYKLTIFTLLQFVLQSSVFLSPSPQSVSAVFRLSPSTQSASVVFSLPVSVPPECLCCRTDSILSEVKGHTQSPVDLHTGSGGSV